MAEKQRVPLDADDLAAALVAQGTFPEDGKVRELLQESLRWGGETAAQALEQADVQLALALRVSATTEESHPLTALLLRTVFRAAPEAAAKIVSECDVAALARSLSYVMVYSCQQVILLARIYACNLQVGRRIFNRCGTLLKEFLAQSSFPYLDIPEELVSDVEHWKKGE